MAHVGKAYPLAFRRDLSLQVNRNAKGWPKQLVALIDNVSGTLAFAAQTRTWLLDVAFDPVTAALDARSPNQIVSGRTLYCKAVGTIGGSPQIYTVKMQWYEAPATLLYEQTVLDFPPSTYQSFGADQRHGVSFETPHVFECVGQVGSFNGFNAKGWH